MPISQKNGSGVSSRGIVGDWQTVGHATDEHTKKHDANRHRRKSVNGHMRTPATAAVGPTNGTRLGNIISVDHLRRQRRRQPPHVVQQGGEARPPLLSSFVVRTSSAQKAPISLKRTQGPREILGCVCVVGRARKLPSPRCGSTDRNSNRVPPSVAPSGCCWPPVSPGKLF